MSSDCLTVRSRRTVEHHHDVPVRRWRSTRAQHGVGEECHTALREAFLHETRSGDDWFHDLHPIIMFATTWSFTSASGSSWEIRMKQVFVAVNRVAATDRVNDPGQSPVSVHFGVVGAAYQVSRGKRSAFLGQHVAQRPRPLPLKKKILGRLPSGVRGAIDEYALGSFSNKKCVSRRRKRLHRVPATSTSGVGLTTCSTESSSA